MLLAISARAVPDMQGYYLATRDVFTYPKKHILLLYLLVLIIRHLEGTFGVGLSLLLCQHFVPSGPLIRIHFYSHLAS